MNETTARLRKTFRYKPDSDDDDSLPEALDEEEQASLISALQQTNAQNNILYARALLALPVLSAILYIRALLFPSSSASTGNGSTSSFYSILSLSSLALSAYRLWVLPESLPATNTTRNTRHARNAGDSGDDIDLDYNQTTTHPAAAATATWRPRHANPINLTKGPLETYLPYLNTALVTLLAVAGLVTQAQGEGLLFALLPGFVYGVVFLAGYIMGSVDVGELEGLRYGYKGA